MRNSHPIEPELQRPVPRHVCTRRAIRPLILLRIFLLPFMLVSLFLICLTAGEICFELFGQITTGRIIEREIEPCMAGETGMDAKSYFIHYEFQVAHTVR